MKIEVRTYSPPRKTYCKPESSYLQFDLLCFLSPDRFIQLMLLYRNLSLSAKSKSPLLKSPRHFTFPPSLYILFASLSCIVPPMIGPTFTTRSNLFFPSEFFSFVRPPQKMADGESFFPMLERSIIFSSELRRGDTPLFFYCAFFYECSAQ